MSDEKDKKDLDQNKSEPDKSTATNKDNNPKATPKEKTIEEIFEVEIVNHSLYFYGTKKKIK